MAGYKEHRFTNPSDVHWWFYVISGSVIHSEASHVRTESRQRDVDGPHQRVYVVTNPQRNNEVTVLWPEQLSRVEVMVRTYD